MRALRPKQDTQMLTGLPLSRTQATTRCQPVKHVGEKLTFAGSLCPPISADVSPCLGQAGCSRNRQRTYEVREGWAWGGSFMDANHRNLFLGRRLTDIMASTLAMRLVENMRPKIFLKIWQAPDTQLYMSF